LSFSSKDGDLAEFGAGLFEAGGDRGLVGHVQAQGVVDSLDLPLVVLDEDLRVTAANPAFLERYLKLGTETGIPVMFPGGHNTLIAQQMGSAHEQVQQARLVGKKLWDAGLPVLDDLHNDTYGWKLPAGTAYTPGKGISFKTERYITALKTLQPGVTMIIMHCTAPTEVFQHISDSGATREGDLRAMLDPALRKAIRDEKIILTTWRELKERRTKAAGAQK